MVSFLLGLTLSVLAVLVGPTSAEAELVFPFATAKCVYPSDVHSEYPLLPFQYQCNSPISPLRVVQEMVFVPSSLPALLAFF